MLGLCLVSTLVMAEPPAAAPTPATVATTTVTTTTAPAEPAPAPVEAAPVSAAAEALPDPQWQEEGMRVTKPGYDLGVNEVNLRKANGTQYKLTARQWRDIVREDPELWRLHVRGRLMVPGIVLTSVGGVWMSISIAFAIDVGQEPSAVAKLFQWGFPAALLVSGAAMTIAGVRARRQLHEARRRMYVAPHANRTGGGLALVGRF